MGERRRRGGAGPKAKLDGTSDGADEEAAFAVDDTSGGPGMASTGFDGCSAVALVPDNCVVSFGADDDAPAVGSVSALSLVDTAVFASGTSCSTSFSEAGGSISLFFFLQPGHVQSLDLEDENGIVSHQRSSFCRVSDALTRQPSASSRLREHPVLLLRLWLPL